MLLDFVAHPHRNSTPSPRSKIRSHLNSPVPCDAAAPRRSNIYFFRWPSEAANALQLPGVLLQQPGAPASPPLAGLCVRACHPRLLNSLTRRHRLAKWQGGHGSAQLLDGQVRHGCCWLLAAREWLSEQPQPLSAPRDAKSPGQRARSAPAGG